MNKLENTQYFKLVEYPVVLDSIEITSNYDKKAFVGFPIRNEYDRVRHKIPDEYNPTYVRHDDGNTYYGIWSDLTREGNELYNFISDFKLLNITDIKTSMNICAKEYDINLSESFLLTNKDTLALTFDQGKKYIDSNHSNLDAIAYNCSSAPSYVKVTGMYIFLFYY